jgi:integrase
MATLRKIKGNYFAYFYDRTRAPKRKSVPLQVSLKDAAEKKLRRLENEWARGDFDPWAPNYGRKLRRVVTYFEAIEMYLVSVEHRRPRTRQDYKQELEAVDVPIGTLLRDLTTDQLKAHIYATHHTRLDRDGKRKVLAQDTRCKRFATLRAFLRWAVEEKLIDANPLDHVSPPRPSSKIPRYLTGKDVDRLLSAIDYMIEKRPKADVAWLRPAVQLALSLGLRSGELRHLRWADVRLDDKTVDVVNRDGYVTKTGGERRIPLPAPAIDVLLELKSQRPHALSSDLVLQDRSGKQIDVYRLSHAFKDAARLATLDARFRFHDTRHTCGSWLAMKGVSAVVIQAILGHATPSTTERYMHLSPETLRAAVDLTFGNGFLNSQPSLV